MSKGSTARAASKLSRTSDRDILLEAEELSAARHDQVLPASARKRVRRLHDEARSRSLKIAFDDPSEIDLDADVDQIALEMTDYGNRRNIPQGARDAIERVLRLDPPYCCTPEAEDDRRAGYDFSTNGTH